MQSNFCSKTAGQSEEARAERASESPRSYLGMSGAGEKCMKKMWLEHRNATEKKFPGRLLRLFKRGHKEEAEFQHDLELLGCDFFGDQTPFVGYKGHVRGHNDGYVRNLPELPGEVVLVEMKTHSEKSFKDLCKKGVKASKPMHYAQMQCYLHYSEED